MFPTLVTEVLVFRTDLRSKQDLSVLSSLLAADRRLTDWSVDLGDSDKVLRVVSAAITPEEVIGIITTAGYFCEELPD
jgi:hypothetical protein